MSSKNQPSPRIQAKVVFLRADEGGWSRPHYSGSRSQLKVGDILTSCILWGPTPESLFEPGIESNLSLELMFWEECGHVIHNGMSIQLSEGSRIVGKGVVTGVIAPSSL